MSPAFAVGTAARCRHVASSQALTSEILRSVSRRHAAPPKPHLGDAAGGAGSGAPLAPGIEESTAPLAPECQSFLDNVVAQRYLIAELSRWNPLARDRFDSDCVLGTQFE